MSANRNFYQNKIFFLIKVITFLNLKSTYNNIAHANFNREFQKINFKIYLLLQSLRYRLGSYVLRTKTKLLTMPISDICLRSKNVKFWNFRSACLVNFSLQETFKIRYSHLLGLNRKSAKSKVLFWSLEHNY